MPTVTVPKGRKMAKGGVALAAARVTDAHFHSAVICCTAKWLWPTTALLIPLFSTFKPPSNQRFTSITRNLKHANCMLWTFDTLQYQCIFPFQFVQIAYQATCIVRSWGGGVTAQRGSKNKRGEAKASGSLEVGRADAAIQMWGTKQNTCRRE